MQFIPSRSLPSMAIYKRVLSAAMPGASLTDARSIYGSGARLTTSRGGVSLSLEVTHTQGRKRSTAVTTVVARVPTRGLSLSLTAARSIPSSWPAARVPHPALDSLGLIAAPLAVAPTVLGDDLLATLAMLRSSNDDPGELTVENDTVTLRFLGWPPDPASARTALELVAEIARRIPSALDRSFGPGSELSQHPEVRALVAWQKARLRFARKLLGTVLTASLAVPLLIALVMR